MDMNEAPEPGTEPPNLRFLRILVTVLTATMIAGVVIIIVLLVTRFPTSDRIALPEAINLPDGTAATAFTRGSGWFAVVTADQRILIFDAPTGKLTQTIAIAHD